MVYAGQLEGANGLRSAASSTQAKRIFVLDGGAYTHPQSPGLRVYDTEFLNFKGTVDLPKFRVPTGDSQFTEYESQGYFVFVNSPLGQVHVLLNADPSSGIQKDWAVTTFDLSKMP